MRKILLAIIATFVLGFAYYAFAPIFMNTEVNDELPDDIILPADDEASMEDESVSEVQEEEIMASGLEELSEERQAEFAEEMEKMKDETQEDMDDAMPEDMVEPEMTEEETEEEVMEENEEDESKEMEEETQLTIDSFPVMPTRGHPASGIVKVLPTTSGTIVRYEDLETLNGPNLHIYLTKDLDAEEYVDLGPIKGTRGNINYEVPDDVDISEYRYVMHWCVPFGVLFNYAEIN